MRRFLLKLLCCICIGFSLSALPGCPPPATIPPTTVPERSAEDIIAALQNHPNAFPSFRAWIKARISYPVEDKRKQHSFDAALLYNQSEDVLRLQGFGTFGRTYFDAVYRPEDMTLYLPPSSTAFYGDPSELPGHYDAGIFQVLTKTMQGLGAQVSRERIAFPDSLYRPMLLEQHGYSLIAVDPQTLLMSSRTLFGNNSTTPMGHIAYGEYHHVQGMLLPGRIEVSVPAQGVYFHFSFDSLSLHEHLDRDLFVIEPPDSTQWLPLTALKIDFLL